MSLPKIPKWPAGLKARLNRKKKKAERLKAIAARKAEIKAARKELAKK